MLYVKVKDGVALKFPYGISDLRKENPNRSLPRKKSKTFLATAGMYPVVVEPVPPFDEKTQLVVRESLPKLVDGEWRLGYSVVEKTPEQREEHRNAASARVRKERNALLAQTDWIALSDNAPMETKWVEYRSALRDLTDQPGFPYDVAWPTKPS